MEGGREREKKRGEGGRERKRGEREGGRERERGEREGGREEEGRESRGCTKGSVCYTNSFTLTKSKQLIQPTTNTK